MRAKFANTMTTVAVLSASLLAQLPSIRLDVDVISSLHTESVVPEGWLEIDKHYSLVVGIGPSFSSLPT